MSIAAAGVARRPPELPGAVAGVLAPLAENAARTGVTVDRTRVRARARGLQVAALARAGLAEDRLGDLWVRAADRDVRDAALARLVAAARWNLPPDHRGDFLAELLGPTLEATRAWRVPPSVTLAQAVLESGWGRSQLARRYHNLFGLKAGGSRHRVTLPTHEWRDGERFAARRAWRTHASWREAIDEHARLLATDRRYARARPLWRDWRAFLDAIAGRYASHPGYADRVAGLVRHYDLDRWDALVARAARADAARRADAPAITADADTGDRAPTDL